MLTEVLYNCGVMQEKEEMHWDVKKSLKSEGKETTKAK